MHSRRMRTRIKNWHKRVIHGSEEVRAYNRMGHVDRWFYILANAEWWKPHCYHRMPKGVMVHHTIGTLYVEIRKGKVRVRTSKEWILMEGEYTNPLALGKGQVLELTPEVDHRLRKMLWASHGENSHL